jgi:SAM-dependent methyltransferase
MTSGDCIRPGPKLKVEIEGGEQKHLHYRHAYDEARRHRCMNTRSVWHEDPEFWETLRDFVFPEEKIEQATEQIDALLELLDLAPDARIADIPCGVGRHSVELADRGFSVTAVDATLSYLETAKERDRNTETEGTIEFIHEDMREFRRQKSFDAILNLYTSFGYFEERDDDERTARNFCESLKPGGKLVMGLTSKETLAGKFEKRTWNEQDGKYILEEHEISDDWNWIDNRWMIVDDGDMTEFSVSHRLYSAFELSELLRHAGFSDVSVYRDFDGSAYDENSEQLVVVAQK